MPVTQTVLINIVVKGGTANISALESPLQQVQVAADKATTSINGVSVATQRLTTQAVGVANVVNATSAAVNTAASNLAMLNSTVNNAIPAMSAFSNAQRTMANTSILMGTALRSETAAVGEFGGGVNRMAAMMNGAFTPAVTKATGASDEFQRIMFTMQKALVSMFIILVAWTAFITIPEMIIKGIVAAFKAAVEAAAALEQQMISLQAVLASTQKFDPDPLKNFKAAGVAAHAMMLELLKRGNEINGTIEESTRLLQTMIAQGVGAYVKNAKEAIDLTILLVNAIGGVTVGQDRMRQLTSEVRQLLNGTLAPSATLANLLFKNTAEMRAFLDHASKSKTLLEDMKTKLIGFVQAVQPMSQTLQGFKTSLQDIGILFSTLSMRQVFDVARVSLNKWRDDFFSNMKVVEEAAAATGAAILVIFQNVARVSGVTSDIFLNTFKALSSGMASTTSTIVWWIQVFSNLGTWINTITVFVWAFVRTVADIPAAIYGIFENMFAAIYNGFVNLINKLRDLAGKAPLPKVGYVDATSEIAKHYEWMVDSLKNLKNLQDPYYASTVAELDVKSKTTKAMKDITEYMKQQKALQDILLNGERQIKEDPKLKAAALELEKLRAEYMMLYVGTDRVAQVQVKYNRAVEDAKIKYKDTGIYLREILSWLAQIETMQLRHIQIESILAKGTAWQTVLKGYKDTKDAIDNMLQSAKIAALGQAGILEKEETAQEKIIKLYNEMVKRALENGGTVQELVKHFKDFNEIAEQIRKNAAAKEWAAHWRAAFNDFLGGFQLTVTRTEELVTATREMMEAYEGGNKSFSATLRFVKDLGIAYYNLINAQEGIVAEMARLNYTMAEGEDFYSPEEIAKMEEYYRRLGIALKNVTSQIHTMLDKMKQIIRPFADAFAQFFEDIVSGSMTVGQAFKKMIGQMISAIGDYIIAQGIAMMAQGFLTWNMHMVALGALYIAIGGAVKGLGALLGGAGGKSTASGSTSSGGGEKAPTPIYIDQAGVATQQGIQHVLMQNTIAINNLNTEVSRLSKESGDTLVTKAVTRNPNAVLKPLTSTMSRSFSAQRQFGGAMLGESA